jgi:hypothetical protein
MRTVREIKQHQVIFGGQEHAGWLPDQAAKPMPTPERHVVVDFAIVQEDSSSFLLIWSGPDKETSGDTWHPDIDAAIEQAESWFGIEPDEWHAKA